MCLSKYHAGYYIINNLPKFFLWTVRSYYSFFLLGGAYWAKKSGRSPLSPTLCHFQQFNSFKNHPSDISPITLSKWYYHKSCYILKSVVKCSQELITVARI